MAYIKTPSEILDRCWFRPTLNVLRQLMNSYDSCKNENKPTEAGKWRAWHNEGHVWVQTRDRETAIHVKELIERENPKYPPYYCYEVQDDDSEEIPEPGILD